ncbi:MAG: pknB 4, partial [Nocardioides sp.]|nr:pknB 4 [Nocardioides sp.]
LLALVAVLLVAGVAWLVLRGGDDPGRDTAAPPAGDRTPSRSPDRSPDRSPSGSATEPSSPAATAETSAPPASGGSRSDFVESYYGVLPDDTESGWAMLSEGYRADTSYDDYRGFWQTIDAVSVDDTAPAPNGAVDVTLTYTSDRGTEQEVRRLELERSGDGYLITGDQAIG